MNIVMKSTQQVTKCKCHKGFRGSRRSEVRFKFSCNLIGNHPQSLTALTLDRYQQGEEKDSDNENDRENGLKLNQKYFYKDLMNLKIKFYL